MNKFIALKDNLYYHRLLHEKIAENRNQDLHKITLNPIALYQLMKKQQKWIPIIEGLQLHPLLYTVRGM